MFVAGYFLHALGTVIDYALLFFMWIVIARAILSWVSPDPYNPIVRFVHNVTEPVLSPIRRRFPLGFGGIDFSPMIILLAVIFLRGFVVSSLMRMAANLM
jgi:YggT family protein